MSHGPDTGYGFPADIPIGPVADGRIELREADGELRVAGSRVTLGTMTRSRCRHATGARP